MPFRASLFALLLLLLAPSVLLSSRPVHAAVPSAALHWARGAFNDNGQAVEHVTLRARNAQGHDAFIRYSLANAGFKRGELAVTFRQESPSGTFYGRQTFARGDYTVQSDRMGLRAGKHTLDVQNGQLVGSCDFGSGFTATFTLSSGLSPISLTDKGGSGYIQRDLIAPVGKLAVKITKADGTVWETTNTGFGVHEASTATAHKVYDRAVQLHDVGGSMLVVDYIVLPAERGGRPLGFVIVHQKGKTFVGEVAKEVRDNEQVDASMGYRVPYLVQVLAKRGESRAGIRMTGEKQVAREDDLADLNYVARKAVAALMHPITYTIKGQAGIEIQSSALEPPTVLDGGAVRYKYAQVR